ncbi:phosphatidylserine decarboxylase [Hathewaya proteolytica DSM 3090]|uniref:Phosphatidylserine decarboxylase proenzyme n=1 Tax=Hathewaya proteolytica DSM 3090 TaxID=1121331 RepID=A0A1M6SDJ3_9CLOT|nr:phosphatidylserine decarboxylase [Hathewaya proteolytica]SHK42813.1 phosphatidylserine decarboxylase [Hathewaya proteolytica DSM 3090]
MIKYYDRKTKKIEIENVAGDKYLNWVYTSPIGKGLLELIVKRKFFSSLYGKYCDSNMSKKKILKFIDEFNIDKELFETVPEDFKNFNDFFARKLKKEHMIFDKSNDVLISPCSARIFAYTDIKSNTVFNIKDFKYTLRDLLDNDQICETYNCGTCLIFRLCPTDYHRFHFIDNGVCSSSNKIKGSYYSVNPISLDTVKKVFVENKREWSVFKSENFDDVIYIEVGATCVGSIIQTYTADAPIQRGDEKGYFKFGGSTVIMLFKENIVEIDHDIVSNSRKGVETLINIGDSIGKRLDR